MNCALAISADSGGELLEAAVQHAIAVHSHEDSLTPGKLQCFASIACILTII